MKKPSFWDKLNPESKEQITFLDWLSLQHPTIRPYIFHIPNERKAKKISGYILKLMGVMPGVSDLFLAWPTGKYHGLFIEMKSGKGKLSESQKEFMAKMNKKDYLAQVCYSWEEAMKLITAYLNT